MIETQPADNKRISPKQVVQILKKDGEKVSLEEAEKMLELMYFFAKLVVNQTSKDLWK